MRGGRSKAVWNISENSSDLVQPPFPYHNGNGENPQRSLQQVASGRRDVRRSSREEFQKIFGQFYSPHHELEIT